MGQQQLLSQFLAKPFERSAQLYQDTYDFAQWKKTTGLDAASIIEDTIWRAPRGVKVFVRPNQYEPGRAHIAVANWDRAAEVKVDLSKVLKEGQEYRIYNVQKLWGEPAVKGAYDGQLVTVPALLTWLAPEFDAFLVVPGAGGEGR